LFLSASDDLPPPLPRGYLGQNWAQGQSLSLNFGGLVAARLTPHWSLNAGLFRSRADNPVSFADLYTNIQPSGQSEHLLIGYPDQRAASTSGEVRLTGRFTSGDWHQELIGLARGRDTLALYGGDATFDAGAANIGAGLQIPEPVFSYSKRTHDRTDLWSIGSAYRIKWRARAEVEIGLQQESYRKDVSSPGIASSTLTDRPLRAYGNAALALTQRLTLYTSYTQGLEDSGVAPGAAQNRGAVLPASRTWQVESGLRYTVTPQLKIITDVYELQKPYFNLDTVNIDRELGVQRAKGFEFSIAGQPFQHLHINAGILAAKVSIVGHDLAAEGVGPIAVGQPRMQYVANLDYSLPWWPALSLDAGAIHFGNEPASVDNRIYSPQVTQWNLGGRYKADAFGKHFTLRVLVENVPNSNQWTNVWTPGYFLWPGPRTVFAYLTADL
jgi:iron complex outermembrane receptor protein